MCFGRNALIDDEEGRMLYRSINSYLYRAVTLRNAAAHSDCLLNALSTKSRYETRARGIISEVQSRYQVDKEVANSVRSIHVALDLSATLICYDMLVPRGETRNAAALLANQTAQRLAVHADWFRKNYGVNQFLAFARELLLSFSEALGVD
jgi:hypothetical protein